MVIRKEELLKLGVPSTRTGIRTLRVFDFDDTIAETNSKVGVIEFDKITNQQLCEKYFINAAEYSKLEKQENKIYHFDYADFDNIVDPKIKEKYFKILKNIVSKIREEDGYPAVILTARGHEANFNIRKYLDSFGITVPVQTLNSSDPFVKSEWIKKVMIERNIPHVEFFDDNSKNVMAVNSLKYDSDLIGLFGNLLRIRSRLVID